MIPVSAQVAAALSGSHTAFTRATAFLGTELRGPVELLGGTVTYDETSGVQSRCSVTIPVPDRPALGAFDPRDLDVSGWRLFLEYCVVIGTDIEAIPLGMFVIYDLEDIDDRQGRRLNITGYDTTVLLRDSRFVSPVYIASGTSYETALEQLSAGANLAADFPSTGFTTPLLFFQEGDDRLAKMQDMATSVGWVVIADPYGLITARSGAPAITSSVAIDFVEGPGCKMTALSKKRTRQQAYSVAVVTGEPAGNTSPVYGVAYDDNPASATYYLGPFGLVPIFEKSQYVTTTNQATAAAQALIGRKRGIGAGLRITTWANPTLRPGDPAHVVRTKMGVDQVVPISSIGLSLVPGVDMQLQTREGAIVT